MKKHYFFGIVVLLLLYVSCKKGDFLDKSKNLEVIDEAQVFSDSTKIFEFLNSIYADTRFSFIKRDYNGQTNKEQTVDDEESRYYGNTQQVSAFVNATLSPSANYNAQIWNMWVVPYRNIRRVNLFLSHINDMPLDEQLRARLEGEARFLRAWYYSYLLNAFGAVPVLGDVVFDAEADLNVPRTPYEECVNYVVKELEGAEKLVPAPEQYDPKDFGRVTKGACLGLKSRVLLFAASPLFNGGLMNIKSQYRVQDQLDERIKAATYHNYDQNRWQKAADAARAVIHSGYYTLEIDNTTKPGYGFYDLFIKKITTELVFFIPQTSNFEYENFWNPLTRSGGSYGHPTHNLVNCFPMKNGKAISEPGSGYNPQNPYTNRDPRLGYSVMYNGSKWSRNTATLEEVWTYNGPGKTNDGLDLAFTSSTGVTSTGYYCRKMCKEETSNVNKTRVERSAPLLRYAEILLNYAEASNEAGHIAEAYEMIKKIRERAGIDAGPDNMYGLKSGMTKEEMREIVRNERRIELAFEDSRFYDVRRWMIAVDSLNKNNMAMKITNTGTATNRVFTYEEISIVSEARKRIFRPEMYLMPIKKDEILNSPNLTQAPGW
jgi:hypothetical protein